VQLIDELCGPGSRSQGYRTSGELSAGWTEVAGVYPTFLVGFGGYVPIRQSSGVVVLDDGDGLSVGELAGGMAVEVAQGQMG
jgi:hypothetical protein